ncbi:MAG: hypothetical protein H6522_04595 [Mycolicibacterium sp.]|nr:hypothetical protein [Mycolicibacterium sp.]
MIGFLSVLAVFMLVTLVSCGAAAAPRLSVANGLHGRRAGADCRALGFGVHPGRVIVSVLGAYLAWTLMAAEILFIPAKTDDMPRFLARTMPRARRCPRW